MPIGSIISQPATNSVNAAYRPIVLRVTATRTDAAITPPVVYCDIYLNDIYYKTLSKTQYTKLNSTNTEWEFDIQDALQEYLEKYLAANGESAVVEAVLLVSKTQCKFRSSGFDADGFIQTEDIAPIQGTDDVGPTSGTGTSSNAFYCVNATLQHEDNQDLASHLDSFKNRTWDATTYPLTHRPDRYKLCVADSDSFPILTDKTPSAVRLNYTNNDGSTGTSDANLPCTPVSISAGTLPNASVGAAFSYTFTLSGTAPFALDNVVKPSWMTISLVDDVVTLSGMPVEADIATDVPVSFDVTNCASDSDSFTDTIDVVAASSCVAVSISGGDPSFPDGVAGTPYLYEVDLLGDLPFSVSVTNKPAWMTVTITELSGSGSGAPSATITFSGTPSATDVGSNIVVDVTVSNCSGVDDERIFDTINVSGAGRNVLVINDTGSTLQLTNANGTATFDTNVGVPWVMTGPIFTITTMTGSHDLDIVTTMPTSIENFPTRIQGDVITVSDYDNTYYLWFRT